MAFGAGQGVGEVEWHCLKGGSQVLSTTMASYITQQNSQAIKFSNHVTAIAQSDSGRMTVTTDAGDDEATTHSYRYTSVISTIPLPCLRTLDISQCPLDARQADVLRPLQATALRQLQYAPSIKIGVKFKSQWWTTGQDNDQKTLGIQGGQSFTDRPIRTVVYPSYGASSTGPTSNVLIASYSLSSDAERWTALINNYGKNPASTRQLDSLVLRDLAAVHNVDINMLKAEFDSLHPWCWGSNPLSMGAFAVFGPGEFGNLYGSLTYPAGNLYFAGEALSTRHGWVVGALYSAWTAVSIYLTRLGDAELYKQFIAIWGDNPDWMEPGKPQRGESPFPDLLLEHLARYRPDVFEK